MKDKIQKLLGASIQHGPLSDRIYLMHLGRAEPERLIPELKLLAREKNYSKIFAKIPGKALKHFLEAGFSREATVPGMYAGSEDAFFLAHFLDPKRGEIRSRETIEEILDVCEKRTGLGHGQLPPGFEPGILSEKDCPDMARLYGRVFQSYPFPITDADYLVQTMRSHVIYAGMYFEGRLAALASAETDPSGQNAELTDFATLPEFRKNRLSGHLLQFLLKELERHPVLNIRTGYTIARAESFGMNITFARSGFTFGGILVNNTNIAGNMESMNIWYKPLSASPEDTAGTASPHLIPLAD